MSGTEVLLTRYGEMLDMITCHSIYNGTLVPKKKKKIWTFDEALALE